MPRPAEHWEGATGAALARRWALPAVHLYERVGSTNDVARELAARGAPAWTVTLAEEQVAGRGRAGRAWASPPGVGIWLSLLLREPASEALGLLPLLVGLAAARALEPFAGPAGVAIKWPNDLLIGGRKLAGVLVEALWEGSVPSVAIVGIGVNIRQLPEDFPIELRASATSLAIAAGRPAPRSEVADALVGGLRAALARPVTSLGVSAAAELRARDALRGQRVVLTGGSAGELRGTAMGIAPDGALLVRTDAGVLHRARSGSARLCESAAPGEGRAAVEAAPNTTREPDSAPAPR